MQNNEFKNRMYGTIIIKSINSNFNADFTHAPRTLPDGTVYATDKALKYSIKDYIKKIYHQDPAKYIFNIKRLNTELKALTLEEARDKLMMELYHLPKERITNLGKTGNLSALLNCFDIKFFGATFTLSGNNLSIHGPLQINHGINRFTEGHTYSEQILAPFQTDEKPRAKSNSEDSEKIDSSATTLGNQTNVLEAHYVYHFSLNPANLRDYFELLDSSNENQDSNKEINIRPHPITNDEVKVIKDAINKGVTYLDSSRKIGSENELSIFITLKENSRKVIPNTSELIDIKKEKGTPGSIIVNANRLAATLLLIEDEIELIEVYYNKVNTLLHGLESLNVKYFDLISGKPFGE